MSSGALRRGGFQEESGQGAAFAGLAARAKGKRPGCRNSYCRSMTSELGSGRNKVDSARAPHAPLAFFAGGSSLDGGGFGGGGGEARGRRIMALQATCGVYGY